MKTTVRIFATLFAFVLLVSTFFAFPVSAAQVTYTASEVFGKKGDTVSVNVNINTSCDLWGANVMLGYDSDELQFVSAVTGDAVSAGSLYNTGSSVNFSGMFEKNKGTVFTVKFKILKSEGSSVLSLTSTENIDYDGKAYTCLATNGKVTVVDPNKVNLGDVNGDGKVSAIDARQILQYATGIRAFTAVQFAAGDVNGDGKVSAIDARRVLQMSTGIA